MLAQDLQVLGVKARPACATLTPIIFLGCVQFVEQQRHGEREGAATKLKRTLAKK